MKTSKHLSKFLKTKDVKAPTNVTISAVEEQEFQEETKLVVYFAEIEQGLVCAKTVIRDLNTFFSPENEDTDEWIGNKAVLYNDPNVLYQGKRVGGLRLRLPE